MRNKLKNLVLRGSAVIGVLSALTFAQHTQATVISSGFGSIPTAATVDFGGSGIPNDTVNWAIIETANGDQVTLGMSATQRFSSPVVTNDGAGNYKAEAGISSGTASKWNFNFFIATTATSIADSLSGLKLFYDVDGSGGTDWGYIDFFAIPPIPPVVLPIVQGSQNLSFGYLFDDALPFISAPAGSYDPNQPGNYEFRLEATYDSALAGTTTNGVGISVSVPEPTGLMLMGLGLLGLGVANRKRSRK